MSQQNSPNYRVARQDDFRAAAQGYKRMKDPNTIKDK